jgi:hypothetical protein
MMCPGIDLVASPDIDEDDSDEDLYVRPAKKNKTATKKISQSMKPASPPKPKKVAVRLSDSSDEELPKAPARPARGAPKKYVEIVSDGEESLFGDRM